VLWALAQPAAVAGLMSAFVLAVGLRAAALRTAARVLGATPVAGAERFCPFGVTAAVLSGTGWGGAGEPPGGSGSLGGRERRMVAVVWAGPAAVLAASQVAFAAFRAVYPELGLELRLNRPSDVLHGAVAPTPAAQLMLSLAVGLLCFGLLALLPVPPFDGYRLFPGAASAVGVAVERVTVVAVLVLLVVPVAGRPPLLALLDAVAGPLVRAWA
jgi:hypothetical protein